MAHIEFNPLSIEEHKARYSIAVMVEWLIAPGMKDRPGQHPEHVFDFNCQTRLIISKEIIFNRIVIHFSASNVKESVMNDLSSFCQHAEKLFRQISGVMAPLQLVNVSKGGIPHWHIAV